MSYRGTGDSSYRSPNDEGSVFSGGSAGGPPLQTLIAACIVLGIVGLIVAFTLSPRGGQTVTTAPAPTAAPAVQPTAPPPTAAPEPTAAPAAGGGATAEGAGGSAIASGTGEPLTMATTPDQLLFSAPTLEAPANTLVTLSFENNTILGVQHNWVLVDGNESVADTINTAAQSNAAGLFTPPAGTAGGLAWTKMANAGETVSVTFTTPAPGTYLYICTFPGHYIAGMKGEFVVR